MNNRLNLTTKRLEALSCPPGRDRETFYDEKTPGLAVRVTPAGSKSFVVYRRVNGRPQRIKLGAWPNDITLDQARKRAAEVNGQIARGNDPGEERRRARAELTFGELFALYLEQHAKVHKRTWREDERQFARYLGDLKVRRLSAISRPDVKALHARLGEQNGPYQANRVLALVHAVFEKAADLCDWQGDNPAGRIQRFREQSRDRYLHGDELRRWFIAVDQELDPFPDFFKLALLTGARRSNVQAMKWQDIDLGRGVWTIPAEASKNGEPMTVVLTKAAIEILQVRAAWREADGGTSPFVFPGRGKSGHLEEPKGAWARILKAAGIEGLRIHDLRRTLGSWQAASGASLPVIGKSLGHKSQQTTAVYARLALDPVRASVDRAVEAMLAELEKPTNPAED